MHCMFRVLNYWVCFVVFKLLCVILKHYFKDFFGKTIHTIVPTFFLAIIGYMRLIVRTFGLELHSMSCWLRISKWPNFWEDMRVAMLQIQLSVISIKNTFVIVIKNTFENISFWREILNKISKYLPYIVSYTTRKPG